MNLASNSWSFFYFIFMHREVPVSCCNDDVMNFLCTSCYALFIHYWRLMFLVPFCCNFYTCEPCKQQLVNFNVFMHCEIPASCCNDDVMNFFYALHVMLCLFTTGGRLLTGNKMVFVNRFLFYVPIITSPVRSGSTALPFLP